MDYLVAENNVEETTAEVATLPERISIDSKTDSSAMPYALISMLVTLAITFVLIFVVWRRHKGKFSFVLGGIATYFVFFLIGGPKIADLILGFMPEAVYSNNGVKILIGGLVTAGFALLGRYMVLRLYQSRLIKLADSTSIGIGLMTMEAAVCIVNYFSYVVFYSALNSSGWQSFIDKEITQNMLDTYVKMYEYEPAMHFAILAWTVIMLLVHLLASVPMYAAYKDKISKGWYAICFGFIFVLQCAYYGYVVGAINVGAWIGMGVATLGFFGYLCMRIYLKYYAKEAFSHIRESEEQEKKENKLPRFSNLSKL